MWLLFSAHKVFMCEADIRWTERPADFLSFTQLKDGVGSK